MFNEGLRFSPDARRYENDPRKKFMSAKNALGVVCVSALFGAGLGATHDVRPIAVEEVTDGGRAEVIDLNVTLSQLHVIGFKSEVDGAFAQDTKKFPPGFLGITPQDYVSSVTINDLLIASDLCMDSKDKKVQYYEADKEYVVRLRADEFKVCSKVDPNSKAIEIPGGNANKHMDAATNDIVRAVKEQWGIDLNDPKKIEEQNQLNSALSKTAENAALRLVNTKCAPLVFDATKEDIKALIAADVPKKPGETVKVILEADSAGQVKISDESDVTQFFQEKEKDPNLTYRVDTVGKCKLAKDLK